MVRSEAVLEAMPSAERGGSIVLGVEPIMHADAVTDETIDGLARLASRAHVCSPDLWTAARIACPADRGLPDAADVRRDRETLHRIATKCARALRMDPSSVLAIRDGASGSYILAGKDFVRIPAVPVCVQDPTGAGNAYASALCAQLAQKQRPVSAALIASAVGAAFVREDAWAPATYEEFGLMRLRLFTCIPTKE
jgi:sugar/nucleoside kinase (ribokinase family)